MEKDERDIIFNGFAGSNKFRDLSQPKVYKRSVLEYPVFKTHREKFPT